MKERLLGDLDPIARGFVAGSTAILVVSVALVPLMLTTPAPPEVLLGDLVDVGIVLVLSYVIESVWLTTRVVQADGDRSVVGFVSALGVAGLVSVIVGILMSAHRAAGHANLLDDLGLAFSVGSLVVLGLLVVLQPLLVESWEARRTSGSPPNADP